MDVSNFEVEIANPMEEISGYSGAKVPTIAQELKSDEKVLWWGQPPPLRAAMGSIAAFIFGIVWTSFICVFLFFIYLAAKQQANPAVWLVALFLIPFLAVGALMLSTPFYTYQRTKLTFYVVTDKRLLVIEGEKKAKSVLACEYSSLSTVFRTEYGDLGDLSWSLPAAISDPHKPSPLNVSGITFSGIKNPRQVESIIQAQIDKSKEMKKVAKATIPSFITEELQKDEPVIWLGQPDKRLAMLGGLPMAAFALFMLCTLLPKIQMALSLNGWMSLLFNGFNLLLFIPICGCLYTPFCNHSARSKSFLCGHRPTHFYLFEKWSADYGALRS